MNAIPFEVLFTEELYQIEGKTVVVTSEPWEKINADGRVLLQKILQAVQLSTEAVTIVHQPVLNTRGFGFFPRRVICFGSRAEGPLYEPTRADDISLILSEPLGQLQLDAAAKQKLWAGLKVLFSS
jgi:hypothetical protein